MKKAKPTPLIVTHAMQHNAAIKRCLDIFTTIPIAHYQKTIQKKDEEELKKILLELYNSVINSPYKKIGLFEDIKNLLTFHKLIQDE